jgi:hypothetical protein
LREPRLTTSSTLLTLLTALQEVETIQLSKSSFYNCLPELTIPAMQSIPIQSQEAIKALKIAELSLLHQ